MRIEKDGNIKNSNFKVQQYNNNVDKKSFIIDRLFFGNYENGDDETKNLYENNPVDLVDCNVSILLTNPDDKINEGSNLYITNLNGDTPTTQDDKISINWLLDRNITNYSGKRSFQLVFSKNNGDIVLRTKVMSFSVLSSLDTEENIIELAPSLIQEWDNKLKDILNQSNDFNTYADTKITEKIENKMYFYKESMQEITTSIENENNFPITMQNYNKDNCITQINVNGIRNTAYTINELNEIVFNTPIAVIGTKIQIFILKAIVSDSIDLNTLKGDKGDPGNDGRDGVGVPTGVINDYAGVNAPDGWLLCHGQEVSRNTYNNLFNVIGTIYGEGDGSTTFNIPDLRSRVSVGLNEGDTDFNTLGNTLGEKTHKLTVAEMPSHTHAIAMSSDGVGYKVERVPFGNTTAWGNSGEPIKSTGGGQEHNNIQPSIVLNKIIKY